MRFQAVIFDLDGTLIETERLVVEAGLATMVQLGYPPRADLLAAMVGTVDDAALLMRAAFGPGFDPMAYERVWQSKVDAAFAAAIPLRPGAFDLLSGLDRIAMPRAIATNSRTEPARANIAAAGIDVFFAADHIHGRDRVANPKPAPDLFLHAARGLGVDPAHCLVFEDSDPGTAAALAAGMTVIQVPDQRPAATKDAHFIAESLMAGARAAGLF